MNKKSIAQKMKDAGFKPLSRAQQQQNIEALTPVWVEEHNDMTTKTDKARECAAKIHRWLTEYNTATDTEQCKQAMNLLTEAEKYLEHFPPSVPCETVQAAAKIAADNIAGGTSKTNFENICEAFANFILDPKLTKENEMFDEVEMPRYKCHKEVWALKIAELRSTSSPNEESDGSLLIIPVEQHFGPIKVDHTYVRKHNPQVGGYYVIYEDGYKSFSPAIAFENGYTRIK